MQVSYFHNFMQSLKTGFGLIDYGYQAMAVVYILSEKHLAWTTWYQITENS